LQDSLEDLKKAGLGVVAISYDSQSTLQRFANAHHITYPLLSDQGSAVIRKFGILNTNIPEGNMFYGIPFPGDYVLAPDGTVKDKHFLDDYQVRPTASGILLTEFDVVSGKAAVVVDADDVSATISLSSEKTTPGQELGVAVDIEVAPGWHIYGTPLPENYVATSVTFDSDIAAAQSLTFPLAVPLEFKALGETLPVYEGSIHAKGTVLISRRLKPGDRKLTGKLKFQECSDTTCKIPQQVAFEIPIKVEAMVPGLKK
jgi:AhpC/TSA family/Disulphide bond corrector protein DsbC